MRKLIIVFLLFPFAATADVITQLEVINTSTGFDQLQVTPFDPALGTLERVDVSINAQVALLGTITTLRPWEVNVGLNIFGLAGNLFRFSDPGITLRDGGTDVTCTPTIGGCLPLTVPVQSIGDFGLSFYFTAVAEDLGLNQAFINGFSTTYAGSPPFTIAGGVSDFLPTPVDVYDLVLISSIRSAGNYNWSGQLSVNGVMQIDYTYSEPVQVSEPGIAALLCIGLYGMRLAGRCRKA